MNDRSISSPQFKRLVDEPRTRQGARLIRRGEGVVPRPNLENLRQTKTAKLVGRMSKTSAKGADQKEYGRAALRHLDFKTLK